jgi:histidinol phosphatase-like PHP family hydrolase
VVAGLVAAARELGPELGYTLVAGAEVTHVPPRLVAGLVERARGLGAGVVVVHGETIVEPVAPGTNRAAIEAGADVLAHPGFITAEEARLAAERGVALEITARRGHCLTNGHVASVAREAGAGLVFGSDTHAPEDLASRSVIEKVLGGAGLSDAEIAEALERAGAIAGRGLERMGAVAGGRVR